MDRGENVVDTNYIFTPGKMSFVMDASFGSSGKGKLGAYICEHADNYHFVANTYMANAAHTVVLDDGTEYTYQHMSSCAYSGKFEKMFICGGSVIELEPMLREIKESGLAADKIGIHPLTAVVQDIDIAYERGTVNFDGSTKENVDSSNLKLGSTLHGVGAARARRILRRDDILYAKDVPELEPYICDTRKEMIDRLKRGQSGLMEIAQGFSLGYLEERFAPKTTSRNCTIAAALDDSGIPPKFAGNVVLNFRTFPIRVNSNKWRDTETNQILKFSEVEDARTRGTLQVIEGDSGAWYEDQEEMTWDDVSELCGERVMEMTSLTQLPRRVATFSRANAIEAIEYNDTGNKTFISINFMNYIDKKIKGAADLTHDHNKTIEWLQKHKDSLGHNGAEVRFIGTGAKMSEMIHLDGTDSYTEIPSVETSSLKVQI